MEAAMKGRGGDTKVNVQLGEPKGAFVGTERPTDGGAGAVPRVSKGKTRVSGDGFHASGTSAATSRKSAGAPTHWRRGGFVTRK
jgi:hypothetical protein